MTKSLRRPWSPKQVKTLNLVTCNAMLMEIIVELHGVFGDYTDSFDKMSMWLRTENLNFGGVSPIDLILTGRGNKVLSFIQSARFAD